MQTVAECCREGFKVAGFQAAERDLEQNGIAAERQKGISRQGFKAAERDLNLQGI